MKFRPALTFLALSFLFGCAGQRLPEGGPVDTVPPEIVSVYPQPGTVNFSDNSIIIEFSEYVERRSAEEAVFISPNVENKELDWSGSELEITFNEELRKNTTYVVTVGTDVNDIRANNRMAKTFTLAFSTGPQIDKGSIEGKVFDDKPDGVMIFSYRLNNLRPDTLNPAITKPDYLSQAGKNGEFQLKNIAPGTYRLFAIRDDYRNLLYEPETDAAGTTDDITITATDTLKRGIHFTLAKEDTTAPRLSVVQSLDNRHVNVQFTEEIDSASVRTTGFAITDTMFTSPVPVTTFFPRDDGYKSIILVTEPQKSEERYILSVQGMIDKTGFPMNPTARAKQFNGSTVKDTIAPVIIKTSIDDRSTKIFPDQRIELFFSDALRWPLADSTLMIRRAKDSLFIPVSLSLRTPASIVLVPKVQFAAAEQYFITCRFKGIADIFGNAGKDTVNHIKFSVEDPENYGSIEGSFAGFSAASTVVQARNIADKKQPAVTTRASTSGAFSFTRLQEGMYVLKVFDDVNKNLKHDAGTVFPFRKSERFTNYSDTIRVRARWPVDGVIFKAP